MKQNLRKVIPILLLGSSVFGAVAQDESRGVVRRRNNDRNATQSVTAVSERMQNFSAAAIPQSPMPTGSGRRSYTAASTLTRMRMRLSIFRKNRSMDRKISSESF